jgi:hypothetical protein
MIKELIDTVTEVSIEQMIELIREGRSVDIIYHEKNDPEPNIIVLSCDGYYCTDIREIHPIISVHSKSQVYIRSHDKKDKIITEWKEYYIHSPSLYTNIKVNKENV